jgi:hypothetical protein
VTEWQYTGEAEAPFSLGGHAVLHSGHGVSELGLGGGVGHLVVGRGVRGEPRYEPYLQSPTMSCHSTSAMSE